MFFDRVFTLPESRDNELDDFAGRVETDRLSSALVDKPGGVAAVNTRGDTFKRSERSENRFAQSPIEELRNNKQIGFHQLFTIRARSHRSVKTFRGTDASFGGLYFAIARRRIRHE